MILSFKIFFTNISFVLLALSLWYPLLHSLTVQSIKSLPDLNLVWLSHFRFHMLNLCCAWELQINEMRPVCIIERWPRWATLDANLNIRFPVFGSCLPVF